MTGNTEAMALAIKEGMQDARVKVDVKDSLQVFPQNLMEYDCVILGSYTWNDGDLPDEFLDFYEEMDQLNLSGKIAAAFGSGDQTYPAFCHAVEILTEKLSELGALVVHSGLKMEHAPDDKGEELCREFGRQLAECLINVQQLSVI